MTVDKISDSVVTGDIVTGIKSETTIINLNIDKNEIFKNSWGGMTDNVIINPSQADIMLWIEEIEHFYDTWKETDLFIEFEIGLGDRVKPSQLLALQIEPNSSETGVEWNWVYDIKENGLTKRYCYIQTESRFSSSYLLEIFVGFFKNNDIFKLISNLEFHEEWDDI